MLLKQSFAHFLFNVTPVSSKTLGLCTSCHGHRHANGRYSDPNPKPNRSNPNPHPNTGPNPSPNFRPHVDGLDTGPKACLPSGEHGAANGVGDDLHGLPTADGPSRDV